MPAKPSAEEVEKAYLAREERFARQIEALKLRRQGKGYQQIATKLGVSYGSAFNLVQTALNETLALEKEEADKLRYMELARLDDLYAAAWGDAMGGTISAIHALVKIIEVRCKILGLYAPTSTVISGKVDHELTGQVSQVSIQANVNDALAKAIQMAKDRREIEARKASAPDIIDAQFTPETALIPAGEQTDE